MLSRLLSALVTLALACGCAAVAHSQATERLQCDVALVGENWSASSATHAQVTLVEQGFRVGEATACPGAAVRIRWADDVLWLTVGPGESERRFVSADSAAAWLRSQRRHDALGLFELPHTAPAPAPPSLDDQIGAETEPADAGTSEPPSTERLGDEVLVDSALTSEQLREPPATEVVAPSDAVAEPTTLPDASLRQGRGERVQTERGSRRSWSMSFAGDSAIDADAQVWLGGMASTCVLVGRVCVGALGRFATDLDGAKIEGAEDSTRRAGDLMLTVERPLPAGRTELRPGIAVGVGAWRSAYDDERNGATVQRTRGGALVRVGAHLFGARPAENRFSMMWGVAVDAAPFGSRDAVAVRDIRVAGPARINGRLLLGWTRGSVANAGRHGRGR